MGTTALIESFVQSFGNSEKVLAHISDDAEWTVHTGGQWPGGKHKGRAAIEELMNGVFGAIYVPSSCSVDIQQILGDTQQAAVRFRLRATTTWGASYDNAYAIFVTARDGKIVQCFELLDGISATEQVAEGAPEI